MLKVGRTEVIRKMCFCQMGFKKIAVLSGKFGKGIQRFNNTCSFGPATAYPTSQGNNGQFPVVQCLQNVIVSEG
jgi:hypothetical protein